MFEMLWGVTCLNVAAAGFVGLNFDGVRPKLGVRTQRVYRYAITLRALRMLRSRVVPFKNRVMDDGCGHYVAQTLVCGVFRRITDSSLCHLRLNFSCWPAPRQK